MFKHQQQHDCVTIQLNRVERLNALNLSMVDGLIELLLTLRDDPQVKRIVIQAEGAHFCAGGDLHELLASADLSLGARIEAVSRFFQRKYQLDRLWQSMPQHTVCEAQGYVYGGGWGLLEGADEKKLHKSVQLAMPECRIGLVPDVGAVQFLRDWPESVALMILLSGMPISQSMAAACGYGQSSYISQRDITHLNILTERLDVSQGLIQFVQDFLNLAAEYEYFNAFSDAMQHNSALSQAMIWHHWKTSVGKTRSECMAIEQRMMVQLVCYGDFNQACAELLHNKRHYKSWVYRQLRSVSPLVIDQFRQALWRKSELDFVEL